MIKKKYFLFILVLLVAVFTIGCTAPPTYTGSDEAKIENTIKQFFSALKYQNWSKAKSCCVYGSGLYDATCDFEETVNILKALCGYVTINTSVNVTDISITGNYAYVICYANISLSACGVIQSENTYAYAELNKIGNSWKLF